MCVEQNEFLCKVWSYEILQGSKSYGQDVNNVIVDLNCIIYEKAMKWYWINSTMSEFEF